MASQVQELRKWRLQLTTDGSWSCVFAIKTLLSAKTPCFVAKA